MKKIIIIFLLLFSSLATACSNKNYDIVTSTFIGYDAARAVMGDDSNIKMLMKPGSDIHSYEPSATDIKIVLNAKVFIYVGGESDEWVSDILINAKDDLIVINMFDILEDELILEEGEDEYDEHIWTDPLNYIKIISEVSDALIKYNLSNKAIYEKNTEKYINDLKIVDISIRNVITKNNIKSIVVADRFPFAYFIKRYNLGYEAAMNGCSSRSDIPAPKVISLINKIEEGKLNYVFVIELSDGRIAKTIKYEIDSDISKKKYDGKSIEIKTLYSMQNISKSDFENKLTYIDFMNQNIKLLENLNN